MKKWVNKIEDKLRENNIRFTMDTAIDGDVYFYFYIGSLPFHFWVQVDEKKKPVVASMHFGDVDDERTDKLEQLFFEDQWMNETSASMVAVFEELLGSAKEFANKFLHQSGKIQRALKTIESVTNELELPENFFIEVNYDFEMD